MRSASLYPRLYGWLLLVAALDIMLTWVVLHLGGSELNAFAARAIEHAGHWGLIAIKFSAAIVVVSICEYIGRQRDVHGRCTRTWAIAIWALPVVFALAQLSMYQG